MLELKDARTLDDVKLAWTAIFEEDKESLKGYLNALSIQELTNLGKILGFKTGGNKGSLIGATLKKCEALARREKVKEEETVAEVVELKVNPEWERVVPSQSKEDIASLRLSIKAKGLTSPIRVNKDYVILDGHTRYRILNQLGVPITRDLIEVVDIPDEEAVPWMGHTNLMGGRKFTKLQAMDWYEKNDPNFFDKVISAEKGEVEDAWKEEVKEILWKKRTERRYFFLKRYAPELIVEELKREKPAVRTPFEVATKMLKYLKWVDAHIGSLRKRDPSITPTTLHKDMLEAGEEARESGGIARIYFEESEYTLAEIYNLLYDRYGDPYVEGPMEKLMTDVIVSVSKILTREHKFESGIEHDKLSTADKKILSFLEKKRDTVVRREQK